MLKPRKIGVKANFATYAGEYIVGGGIMYAVVETGGKQYKVQEGDTLRVELLNAEAGSTVELDKVLMVNTDGDLKVGSPYVEGAKVTLKVEEHGKGKKIIVYKYKAKKNYRKKQGHRQPFTKVVVEKIEA